ncbi:hypothetical protein Acr_00g0064190 [Actinidia rufa]|uniref:Uncharacterized protein n=1 Tax=Actinidia rufa TaxID=165716 RepID=A0A7J0DPG9_9ERIC|nr:hypothetical protein Acr_00g0064190 [Actinidia rufa]
MANSWAIITKDGDQWGYWLLGVPQLAPFFKEIKIESQLGFIDCAIGDFHLTICLRMTRRGEMMGDSEVRAELLESIVVKLAGVIRDDNLGNSKSIDDVLPYKIPGVPLCDLGERLSLYPLGWRHLRNVPKKDLLYKVCNNIINPRPSYVYLIDGFGDLNAQVWQELQRYTHVRDEIKGRTPFDDLWRGNLFVLGLLQANSH